MTKSTAKLFMHGRSQAVRLPKEFRMEGTEVEIWKDGDVVYMKPFIQLTNPWSKVFSELRKLPDVDGFMEERVQPILGPQPKNLIDDDE